MKNILRSFLSVAAVMTVSINAWSATGSRPVKLMWCDGYNMETGSQIKLSVTLKTDIQGKPVKNRNTGYYEYAVDFPGTGSKSNASAEVPSNGGGFNILLWSDESHSPIDDGYVGRILIESTQGAPSSLRYPAHGWLTNSKSKKIGFNFFCQINS